MSKNKQKNREPHRNSREAFEMFSEYYSTLKTFSSAVSRCYFPSPDLVVESSARCGKKLYWKISTLEKELKRRKSLDS